MLENKPVVLGKPIIILAVCVPFSNVFWAFASPKEAKPAKATASPRIRFLTFIINFLFILWSLLRSRQEGREPLIFATRATFALQLIEDNLTHTHTVGGHLYVLVCLDVLKSILETKDNGRGQSHLIVATRGAHIG